MSIEDFIIRVMRDIARRGGVFAYRWWRRLLLLWVVGMAGTSVWNAFNPWSEFNRGLIYDPGAEVLLVVVGEIEVSGFFACDFVSFDFLAPPLLPLLPRLS